MTVKDRLLNAFHEIPFTLKEAYEALPDIKKESIRGRIYENLGVVFKKIGRSLYVAEDFDCVLIEGDGRSLDILEDNSVDCIITDHPWLDEKSNTGGGREFADYQCFRYTQEDFNEKARVLKYGSFLCEILPAENENNFEYLFNIKKMALAAGFQYYAKVTWKKGTFVSNTGRKAKNTEDIMIFSKGKPRALRPDKQRVSTSGTVIRRMSGANGMLPTNFETLDDTMEELDVQAVSKSSRHYCSEKPVKLFEQLLEFLTLEGELVLDQFAGSGTLGVACKNKKRQCILIEKLHYAVEIIQNRLWLNRPIVS